MHESPHGSSDELRRGSINVSGGTGNVKASWCSLFGFTTKQHSAALAIALVSTIFSALLKPTAAIFYGKIFSVLTKFGLGTLSSRETIDGISGWCTALAGLGAAAWIVEGAFLSSWMAFGELQARSVREYMFTGMLDKEMEWYDLRQDGIGSLLIRIQTQIRELQLAVSQPMGFLAYEIFGSLAALGLAFYYSWALTLVIIATFPIAGAILFFVSMQLSPAIEAQKRELTRASKYASTAITAINTVKAYNGQDQEVWQYYDTIRKAAMSYLIQARCNALQFGISKFVMVGLFVQGFWFGLILVKQGMDPGGILTTFYACLAAMQAIETILPQWLVLTKGISAGQTLKSIMSQVENGRVVTNMTGSSRPETCEGDIEVKGVSFAYPSNLQQNVLNDADFFFPAGETTFIVGTSGSGKSTLGNLLMKYYEPLQGKILIDGNSIKTLASGWLRQNVTLVQQQSVLFNETILQNIEFGRSKPATRQDILEATKTADLEQTLLDLPDGLHTVVGSNGKSLSGGQQQRITLARARLRDAPIVILDEATSALDQKSRQKVTKTVREWRKGKTTIVITHDVTQILDDEYVYVLEHGVVVQEGYRKKLAEKKHGTFASFLPAEKTPDTSAITSWQRRASEPASLKANSDPEDFDERVPRRSGYVSKFFGIQEGMPSAFNRGLGAHEGQSLALGGGAAQAYAIHANEIWSSPIPPLEDGIFPPFTSSTLRRTSFKEFVSPEAVHQKNFEPMSLSNPQKDMALPISTTSKLRSRTPAITITTNNSPAPADEIELEVRSPVLPRPKPSNLGNREPASLRHIFGTIWPTLKWQDRCFFALGFGSALIVAGGTPAFAYVFAKLLQVYYLAENREAEALKWAMSLLAIAIVDGVSTFVSHYSLEHSGQAWVNTLRVEALKRILAQPRSWFDQERNSPGKLNECLDRNAEEMRNLIGRFAGPIFTTFWMLTISVIWAFVISWKLSLVAVGCAPVMYAVTRLFNWTSARWEDRCNHASDNTSSIFTETFANIRVVRALTLENHFKKKYNSATDFTYRTGTFRAAYSGLLFGLSDTLSYFITALIFYYGTVIITSDEVPVSAILEVVNLLLFGIANAVSMLNFVPQINTSRTTATHMLYLANLPPASSPSNVNGEKQKRLATPFPVVLSNLSFTYPTRPDIKTLDSISLQIAAGTCTALVGPSGSGKSTIASLLLGLYPPEATAAANSPPPLTFNCVPIEHCNLFSLRTFISFVPQQSLLFPTTVLSNITYGLPPGSPFSNVHAAMQAAQDAGIHDFIASLPSGYGTQIGEGGQGLSGGQAQRIAIARALVRRPKILVLDEATSALDKVSAEAVKETVRRFLERGRESAEGGTAVVVISHGVEMMRVADEVVVLEHGKVVERGPFEELRLRGGAFSRLVGYKKADGVEVKDTKTMTPVKGRSRESWAAGRKFSA
ncbi:bile salt export pump [Diplocarpon rosae]|nr:bile salt export pump [Diplocarpon rosae]